MGIIKKIKRFFKKAKTDKEVDGIAILKETIFNNTGVDFESLRSNNRFQENVEARVLFAYFAEKYLGKSKEEISKIINKSRTTIYHYIKEYDIRIGYKLFNSKVECIKSELKSKIWN